MKEVTPLTSHLRQGPGNWTYRYPGPTQPFPFEQIDAHWWIEWISNHMALSLYAGTIYVLVIFALQKWMENRPGMHLKTTLFLWNSALGLFSILGFVRTAPGLLSTLVRSNGFYASICTKNWLDTPIAFWTILFVFSKYVELGDTVFILLRKRQLILLHWFHHVVTLNSVWIVGPMVEPQQVLFMVINYGVHSLMYPYFALKALGVKIPKKCANFITTLQLSQMVIGFAVNMISTYYYKIGEHCARSDFSINLFGLVYGSFILLFGKLFLDSVIKSGRMKKNGKYEGVKMD